MDMNVRYMAGIDGSPKRGYIVKMYLDGSMNRLESAGELSDAVRLAKLWTRNSMFPGEPPRPATEVAEGGCAPRVGTVCPLSADPETLSTSGLDSNKIEHQ